MIIPENILIKAVIVRTGILCISISLQSIFLKSKDIIIIVIAIITVIDIIIVSSIFKIKKDEKSKLGIVTKSPKVVTIGDVTLSGSKLFLKE